MRNKIEKKVTLLNFNLTKYRFCRIILKRIGLAKIRIANVI